jgi:hypothetical protein
MDVRRISLHTGCGNPGLFQQVPRAFLLMVCAEDEVLAPFFLKKNGFREAHPVGRIRRNALQEV